MVECCGFSQRVRQETAVLALAMLCFVLLKKDPEITYGHNLNSQESKPLWNISYWPATMDTTLWIPKLVVPNIPRTHSKKK